MRVTTHTSWKFYTYSKKCTVKCSKCGKSITKTFSESYREGSSHEKYIEMSDSIDKRIEAYKLQGHVCKKCTESSFSNTSHENIDFSYSELESINNAVEDLMNKGSLIAKEVTKKYEGLVCLIKNEEHVFHYVSFCGRDVSYHFYKVNKVNRWRTTDAYVYVYGNDIKDVVFTNEVFSSRLEKVKTSG